eukprot:COSAG05_NODE_156_length_15696_cov_359.955440_22_plen_71_part_00
MYGKLKSIQTFQNNEHDLIWMTGYVLPVICCWDGNGCEYVGRRSVGRLQVRLPPPPYYLSWMPLVYIWGI